MKTIFVDFETYYDKDYSLRKMTTLEYVMHPKFQVLGTAVAENDGVAYWVDGADLPKLDWANSEVVAHNMLFDGLVMAQHFGVIPKKWGCTLAMAKAMIPSHDHRLATIAKNLGLGEKGDGLTLGATKSDQRLIDYAIQDVELCRGIYNKLIDGFPENERELIHLTQRWGVEPSLELNIPRLEKAFSLAVSERQKVIEASGVDEKVLTSNPQFVKYLQEQGIDVPWKAELSASGWPVPALSKGDPEFHRCVAKNPDHAKIFAGRLAAKSNIDLRRPEKLLSVAKCTKKHLMPMPLKYYGAHTGRWSGADGLNVQNFRRDSEVRKSIIAPRGYVIAVADSAQIELRLNAWWSGEYGALEELRNGNDLYIGTAAVQFDIKKENVTKQQRQFGKAVTLGCGYGMGAKKFQSFCGAGPLGMKPLTLKTEDAYAAIQRYRLQYANIASSWRKMDFFIRDMAVMTDGRHTEHKCVQFHAGRALLPNGMNIWYPALDDTEEGSSYSFGYGKRKAFIYGARLQENLVQGLARIVIADQILEMEKHGIQTVGSTHDEILCIVRRGEAKVKLAEMIEIMSTPPSWAPDLPLDAEGGFAKEYSK